jgi:glycosyltransferase involved in cell wall biosynthesis
MIKKLLFIAFYPLDNLGSAPKVRINALKKEFEKKVDLLFINGGKIKRLKEYIKIIFSSKLANISKCYVESSTSSAYPWDIIFLLYLKIKGVKISIYIRDAYPLFKEFWKELKWYQIPLYIGWHISVRLYHQLADIIYYPTESLKIMFNSKKGKLLPPASGNIVDKFSSESSNLLYVGNLNYRYGLSLMFEVEKIVREQIPDFEWVIVSHFFNSYELERGITIIKKDFSQLNELKMEFFAGIIPRRKSKYNDLALPVKLFDYLKWGLPIIATNCYEQEKFIKDNKIGETFLDRAKELSDGIIKLYSKKKKLEEFHKNVLSIVNEKHRWKDRAEKILADLNKL